MAASQAAFKEAARKGNCNFVPPFVIELSIFAADGTGASVDLTTACSVSGRLRIASAQCSVNSFAPIRRVASALRDRLFELIEGNLGRLFRVSHTTATIVRWRTVRAYA
jgi:hypothetical protein